MINFRGKVMALRSNAVELLDDNGVSFTFNISNSNMTVYDKLPRFKLNEYYDITVQLDNDKGFKRFNLHNGEVTKFNLEELNFMGDDIYLDIVGPVVFIQENLGKLELYTEIFVKVE